MRYVLALLFTLTCLGCTEHFSEDPITSANGLAFMSSRIPANQDIITASDIVESTQPSDLLECSAHALLKELEKEAPEKAY